ncbi:MAG: hypothetical protein U0L84_06055 [Acutalibacteraceae bacterium]|nr:hypothetical protein [Acutalibacteraceae bacterium]
MKNFIIILLNIFMVLSLTACGDNGSENLDALQSVVMDYYNRTYDCYIDLKYEDMSDVLYLESIPAYNMDTELKKMITRAECSIEAGFGHETEKAKYAYDFGETVYNNDGTATVTVDVERMDKPDENTVNIISDPYFIFLGNNVFTLIQDNNKWKITSHTADTMNWWDEYSADEKIEFNKEQEIAKFYSEFE